MSTVAHFTPMQAAIREMQPNDIPLVVDYFINADTRFLIGMGVDRSKLPKRDQWIEEMARELEKDYEQMKIYHIIWLLNESPVGHSKLTDIEYGNVANMHLHIWHPEVRKAGYGCEFLKQTIPLFFPRFKLKYLICEPYALNPAPNGVLPKLGFEFEQEYDTLPGPIAFFQPVNRYVLTREDMEKIRKNGTVQNHSPREGHRDSLKILWRSFR